MVIEGPPADVPSARLQSLPSAAQDLRADDGHDPPQRLVQPRARALEPNGAGRIHAGDERQSSQLTVELPDDARFEGTAVVCQRHGPKQLSKGHRPGQVGLVEAGPPSGQAVGVKPGTERCGRGELLRSLLDVDRVDELLHRPEIAGRRNPGAGFELLVRRVREAAVVAIASRRDARACVHAYQYAGFDGMSNRPPETGGRSDPARWSEDTMKCCGQQTDRRGSVTR
jgi:hypothetical protein